VAKLRITALDGEHQGEVLEAQFNPKEIEVDRPIPRAAPWDAVLLRFWEPSRRG
jgi:hypothetical protein